MKPLYFYTSSSIVEKDINRFLSKNDSFTTHRFEDSELEDIIQFRLIPHTLRDSDNWFYGVLFRTKSSSSLICLAELGQEIKLMLNPSVEDRTYITHFFRASRPAVEELNLLLRGF